MAYQYNYDSEERTVASPKLRTDRQMWKLMLFNFLTCGIYSIAFFMPFSYDLDKIAPKPDRTKTINYMVAYIVSLFTFAIVMVFWHHQIAQRVEEALVKRNIDYEFSTSSFWGWYFFGSFILVGPFVYFHKLCVAMNMLCESYNENPVIEN